MTAVCLFADNRHAYLATDGAAYDVNDGTVAALFGKALVAESVRVVFAITGRWGPADLAQALGRAHSSEPGTQRSILRATRGALEELFATERERFTGTGLSGGAVFAAAYDMSLHRPRTMMMHTECFPGRSDDQAWVWHEDEVGFVMPQLSAAEIADIFPKGTLVRPRREMTRIMQRQRHISMVNGVCGVGGPCHFYRVGQRGVEFDEMLRFPEIVGERLDPARRGVRLSSRLDDALAR